MKKVEWPRAENIKETTPLRLEVAARLAFPDGSVTVSTLRRQIANGLLVAEKIGNKLYTTPQAILEMRERCRVQAKDPALSCKRRETGSDSGSSGMASEASALDALRANAAKLKQSLLNTSSANATPEQAVTAVIPMRSK
ncbi:MAG: hypothetical protein WA418_22780 [Bradyrhizobium sp.]